MKFWIGDPCYAFDLISDKHDDWIDLLNKADYFEPPTFVKYKDRWIGASSTAYGDGIYSGNDGNKYPVDAGLIGFTEWKEGDKTPFGSFLHEFSEVPHIQYEHGLILISDSTGKIVSIDTDPNCQNEEEWNDEYTATDDYWDDED